MIGNNSITARYVGTSAIQAIYKGASLVWQSLLSEAATDAIYAAWYATSWYAQEPDFYNYGFMWEQDYIRYYGISYSPTTAMTYISVDRRTGVLDEGV